MFAQALSGTFIAASVFIAGLWIFVTPNATAYPTRDSNGVLCALMPGAMTTSGKDYDAATGACVDGYGICSFTTLARSSAPVGPRLAMLRLAEPQRVRSASLLDSPCAQAKFENPPNWITTAFWDPKTSLLGTLNSHSGQISLYDLGGKLKRRIESKVRLEAVASYQGRLLAKERGSGAFFLLNDQLEPSSPFRLLGFGSLYGGWVVNGDEIVAYGSALPANVDQGTPNKSFELGFVRVNIRKRSAELVLPFGNNRFYLINHSYIASTGGNAYFLAMDKRATIYRLPKQRPPVPLKTMPEGCSKVPQLGEFGPATVRERFREIESFTMPAGLYGYGGFLYLLARDPEACSPWLLHKIDPINDRLIGSVPLPSLARRLALVPGEQQWILIEKGSVIAGGEERIKSIQLVPSSWLTNPNESRLNIRPELTSCITGD